MKRVTFLFVLILSLLAGKLTAQCVDVGAAMTEICQGGTSGNLGGSIGSDAVSGTWSSASGGTFNPGPNDLNATWTPPPGFSGTATLILTANGGATCDGIYDSKDIIVNPNPTVDVGGAMATICEGGVSDPLGGSVGGSATGGTWSTTAGGTFSPDADDLNATWDPGPFIGTATLVLTTSGGTCGTTSDSKTVEVILNPTVDAGPAVTAFCQGGTSASLGGSVGGSATGGIWTTTAGGTFAPSASALNATWTPPPGYSGTATLQLTTTGSLCGNISDTKSVTVNPLPVANIQLPSVCEDTYGGGSSAGVDLTALNTAITSGAANRSVTWYSNSGHSIPVPVPSNVTVTDGQVFYPMVQNTLTGCINYTTVTYTVNAKPIPANVQINGIMKDGVTITVSYDKNYYPVTCSDEVLSQTEISWYRADDNSGFNSTWVLTRPATDLTYEVTSSDVGSYIRACVKLSDGSLPIAAPVCSNWSAQVTSNDPPSAGIVTITGTPQVKQSLTGSYTYSDTENDPQGQTTFQWYSNDVEDYLTATPIDGATSLILELKNAQKDKYIELRVTPIATKGTLVGPPSNSVWVGPVNNNPPVASMVYITGSASIDANSALIGHYTYSDAEGDAEDGSTYMWSVSDNVVEPYSYSPIIGETGISHVITMSEQGKYFKFSVTPATSGGTIEGSEVFSSAYGPANSKPYATIVTISGSAMVGRTLTGSYSYDDPDSDTEGTSRFRWLRDGVPIAGAVNSSYLLTMSDEGRRIIFEVTPVSATGYPDTGDPALSSATPEVLKNDVDFYGFNTVYCWDGGTDTISVLNVPDTATFLTFTLTNPLARIDLLSPDKIVIDPSKMRPGNKNDTLFFSYTDGGSVFSISRAFVIDSVSNAIEIVNIDPAYCYGSDRQLITVEGTYPGGGAGIWDGGTFVTHNSPTSAYLELKDAISNNTYSFTYQYISPSLCRSSIISKSVVINPLPNPYFPLNPTYNFDGEPETLVPIQPGGTFFSAIVSGDRLIPDNADAGEYDVRYNITDANSCSDTLIRKTTIRKAKGSIDSLPQTICYDDITYKIIISDLPSGTTDYKWSNAKNTIDTTNHDTIAYYNVTAVGGGTDEVVFYYKWDGVDYKLSQSTNVDKLEEIEFIKFPSDTLICNNSASVELVAYPKGGTFTGPFVVGGYLYPQKATGYTSDTLLYTYTNLATGCFITKKVPFTISPAPAVSFSPVDNCIENGSDVTYFLNYTTPADSIKSWKWTFYDDEAHTDTIKEPGYLFKTGGLYRVSLAATANDGCFATVDSIINLGVKPTADFFWKNDCYSPGESISLFDATSSVNPIVARSWNVVGEAPFSAQLNPEYPKYATGYINIHYSVQTSYSSCNDEITKAIFIRPTINLLPDAPYVQDFEAGNGDWVKDGDDTSNIWSFGKPDGSVINSASSGQGAWFTKLTEQKVDTSSIISPCFNFVEIERPMISLKIRSKFDKNRDGAVLQYRAGDEGDWMPVGTIDDGINWFNSPLISGEPGGDKLGWTTLDTADTKWKEASHTLDELIGRKDVKLRFAYGSNGTSVENEGLAFDDIWIGERTRNVLLEHFTNSSDNDSRVATALVNKITENKNTDVVNIQYHTNFPGSDPFYTSNPGDASARILFYGLTRVPYTFVDGGNRINFANLFDNDMVKIDSNDVARRSLIRPRFNISIKTTASDDVLTVGTRITALENIDSEDITLYLVVTEKENDDIQGINGETIFYNIFRKFIPDAGGLNLKKNWTTGEDLQLPDKTWIIENIKNSSDIKVIAFIQNNITKELYQAVSDTVQYRIVGIKDLFQDQSTDFALYPNPAVNKLTVAFREPLRHDADILLYDMLGVVVASYKAGSGISDYTIENPGLRGGIYLVRVSSGGKTIGFRKLIISGD